MTWDEWPIPQGLNRSRTSAEQTGPERTRSGTGRQRRLAAPARRDTILPVTSRPAAAQHLRHLARLRRVRDRIDREYAQPLDVEALARGAHLSAGHLSREFRLAYGESPYGESPYGETARLTALVAQHAAGLITRARLAFALRWSLRRRKHQVPGTRMRFL